MDGWVVGVVLAVAAAMAAALGDNLVHYSFQKHRKLEAATDDAKPVKMYKRPLWLLGNFCNMGLNTALSLGSYAFADASITIPFGGLHIVFNIPLALYMNGEVTSRRALGCNSLILAGVLVVLVSGNHDSERFTVPELMKNLVQPMFLACTAALILGLVVSRFYMCRSPRAAVRRLGFTIFSGLVGASTQVFAKSMSESLGEAGFKHPYTYFCVVTTIVLALSQAYLLNRCLDMYKATFVVPIVNATLIVVGSLYAAVYFREMDRWSTFSKILVPVGISLTALGIGMLATEQEMEGRPAALSELSSAPFDETLLVERRESNDEAVPSDEAPLMVVT